MTSMAVGACTEDDTKNEKTEANGVSQAQRFTLSRW